MSLVDDVIGTFDTDFETRDKTTRRGRVVGYLIMGLSAAFSITLYWHAISALIAAL